MFAQFITEAYAQAGGSGPSSGSGWMSLFPLLLMVLIFYFLLIRPSQKKEKDRKKMIEALQKGDKVITAGGIYGVISNIKTEENIVVLKIADSTKVEFSKTAIQSKVS